MARSLFLTINSGLVSSSWSGDGYYGFGVVGYYYQEQIAPGQTRVTWDYYTRYIKETYYAANKYTARTVIRTQVASPTGTISSITGEEFDGTGTYRDSNGNATNSFLFSGSCIITHTTAGAASFQVTFDANTASDTAGKYCGIWIGGWGGSTNTASSNLRPNPITQSASLATNYSYTACGAPTTVSASGIITPSGSFTVSWSGATAGTANSITSYRIYYAVTNNGAAPSTSSSYVDVSSTATSGSKTITLKNATRGYKVVCGVQTRGSAGSSYYSGLKTGGSVIINSLPAAPSVSVDKTTLPSSGGTVTFTVSAGSDNNSSQTKTLYYSTSASGTKTKFTSPLKPTITSNSTYYFWTYDGLEYSGSYTSKLISINTKPAISVSMTGTTLTSDNSVSSYLYRINPTVTATQTAGTGSTYTFYLSYGTSTSNIGNKTSVQSSSSKTYYISDIRTKIAPSTSSGLYYRFSVICNDSLENSEEVWSDIYYITKVPALKGIYNKSDYSNVSNFASGNFATHYYDFLGFVFDKDAGYNILKFNTTSANTKTLSSSSSPSGLITSITEDAAPSVLSMDLKYQIGYSSSGFYSSATSQTITKISKINPANLKLGIGTYKYFTQSSDEFSNTVNPQFGADPTNGSSLKDFGIYFTGTPSYLKGRIYNGSSWSNRFDVAIKKLDDNTINFIVKASDLASYFSSISNKNTSYSSKLQLIFINNFGKEFTVDGSFTTDFREPDYISMNTNDYKMYMGDDTNKNAISKWAYLKQGMGNLMGDFKVLSYNTGVKITIQFAQNDNSWQNLASFELSASTTPSPGVRAEYTAYSKLIKAIEEITTKNYNVSYRAIIDTDGGSKTVELYNNIKVRGHFAPVVLIKANTYKNKTLNVKYEIIENGADSDGLWLQNGKVTLKSENSADVVYIDDTSNYFDSVSKDAVFTDYEFGNVESKFAKLVITSSFGTYLKDSVDNIVFITQKTSSTELDNIIFNIVPTISYRKNHLGINVLDPDNKPDAILIIGETSAEDTTRDTIYFQTSGTNLCKVVNFLLDGGHW